jgi:hypothetical protein
MKILQTFAIAILLSVTPILAQTIKYESVYTNLSGKSCKTLEQSDEGTGWYRGECKGVGGYKLQVTEGDIRQSIDVVAPNKKRYELNLTGNVSPAFSSVGEKAEWRVTRKGKTIAPVALIVRYNASENSEKPEQNTSYLVVVKITKNSACVTDVVKPSVNANAEARVLADVSVNKPCKSEN